MRLVVLHDGGRLGEQSGVRAQHVDSLRLLLEPVGWSVQEAFPAQLGSATLRECEVLLVQMLVDPAIEPLAAERRARGLVTVYEITDDITRPGEWLAEAHPFRSPLHRQRVLHLAWSCDALQVYSAGLARLYGPVTGALLRFDPYVGVLASLPPTESRPLTVGWGGTRSHAEDLAEVAPVLRRFADEDPATELALMGDRRMLDDCGLLREASNDRVQPFSEFAAYVDFVSTWDVGLAPLRDTPFNASRSDTRFALYAAHGVCAVLPRAPAYAAHRSRSLQYRDEAELLGLLRDLRDRPHARERVRRAAHRWALRERSHGRLSVQRDGTYRRLLAQPTRRRPLPVPASLAAHPGLRPAADRLRGRPFDFFSLAHSVRHLRTCAPGDPALPALRRRLFLVAPDEATSPGVGSGCPP